MTGKRVFGLDVLRAIAILLVVLGHGMQLLPSLSSMANFADKFFYLGVEIFFVLSGFLIGGILIKTISFDSTFNDILTFWKRRWWRTLPNYYLFLLINIVGFGLLKPGFVFDWSYLVFAQNLLAPNAGFFSVSWSLAVEEWFYLVSPLIYYFFLRLTKNTITSFGFACLSVITASMLVRIYYIACCDVTWNEDMRKVVFLRLDSLMYGVIVAWLWWRYKDWLQKHKVNFLLVGVFFLGVSVAIKNSPQINTSGLLLFFMFPLASLGAALCIPWFAAWADQPRSLSVSKSITYTSLWSYSLYLIHIPLLEIYKIVIFPWLRASLLSQVFGFLVWLLIAYSLSFMLYRFFELPMMQLREKNLSNVFSKDNT